MKYRRLGKTGLSVSEIGLGAEWLQRHTDAEAKAIIDRCEEYGINILDCWMSDPEVRSRIGDALVGRRDKWIIQGHVGSTWQNGQYVRTREMDVTVPAFEDFLRRFHTDYVDIGVINYVDDDNDWNNVINTEFADYVNKLREQGTIGHIGISTHNPEIAKKAINSGLVEMILFSINPAYDLLPASDDIEVMFADEYDPELGGISKDRFELYRLCEEKDIGITVMKGYAGGRLFDAARSPFGTALTPVQCIHYCLTRPKVASVLVGYDTVEHVDEAVAYENASDDEKDYASVLANAPKHSYTGQCTYCGHCHPCPMNIDIAMVNKFCDLASEQAEVPDSIRNHYNQLSVKAGECIGCRSCEDRCPFGVKIADKMSLALELFGE